MSNRKPIMKYYFSVEGETEEWYLKWLQNIINQYNSSKYKVSFDCRIQKNPLKRAKGISITDKVVVWHISDYESNDDDHVNQFVETMDRMKSAQQIGKNITYKFGYSNFTFELWMILHKSECEKTFYHRNNYLDIINKVFNENFENLSQYKREQNFKKCLKKLSIQNVVEAVDRAKKIMLSNEEKGYTMQLYKGFKYYRENPSLTIHEIIGSILKDCKII